MKKHTPGEMKILTRELQRADVILQEHKGFQFYFIQYAVIKDLLRVIDWVKMDKGTKL